MLGHTQNARAIHDCHFRMDKFDFDVLLHKIMGKSEYIGNTHSCIIWKGAQNDNGYGRMRNPFISLPNQSTHVKIHRLVYFIHNFKQYRDGIPRYDIHGHDLDISHICHNKCCINIDHLVLENHYISCDR